MPNVKEKGEVPELKGKRENVKGERKMSKT